MIKSVSGLIEKELFGKKDLLRVDFNVPVADGKIIESYRIISVKETVDYLASRGAVVAILSHITAIKSFKPLVGQIKETLGRDLKFIPGSNIGPDITANLKLAESGKIFFLENVRQNPAEEANDENFAKELAANFDIYVNDAFAVCHREHASLSAITKFLPSYGGLLLMKEIEHLTKAIEMPREGKTLILGGAKVNTKFPVIKNFLNKAENILIGGAVANVFLKAKGIAIGESLTDDSFLEDAKNIINSKAGIIIPEDYIESECMILDIGQKTTAEFSEIIGKSKVIIWNGPLGRIETPELAHGSESVAKAITNSKAFSIAGGGDTIVLIRKMNLMDKFSYISTGGGAMLNFLAGKSLPGLMALNHNG